MSLKNYIIITLTLLLLATTCVFAATFVDVGNNVIRDTDNDLEWINHTFKRRNWTDQTSAVDDLTYLGISDWRLPTKTELLTVVSSTHDPKIDPLFNLGAVRNWTCWTSTAVIGGRSVLTKKYAVFFGDGRALTVPAQSHKAALYVRDSTGWKWNNDNYMTWNDGSQIRIND